jgi:hypothetical protein
MTDPSSDREAPQVRARCAPSMAARSSGPLPVAPSAPGEARLAAGAPPAMVRCFPARRPQLPPPCDSAGSRRPHPRPRPRRRGRRASAGPEAIRSPSVREARHSARSPLPPRPHRDRSDRDEARAHQPTTGEHRASAGRTGHQHLHPDRSSPDWRSLRDDSRADLVDRATTPASPSGSSGAPRRYQVHPAPLGSPRHAVPGVIERGRRHE